jgi:hypothetical protein
MLDLHSVEWWVSMKADSDMMCEWNCSGLISGTFLDVRGKTMKNRCIAGLHAEIWTTNTPNKKNEC